MNQSLLSQVDASLIIRLYSFLVIELVNNDFSPSEATLLSPFNSQFFLVSILEIDHLNCFPLMSLNCNETLL